MNNVDKKTYNAHTKEHTMSTFSKLKKSSGNVARLADEIKKLNEPEQTKSFVDPDEETYWKLPRDNMGNGSATIRFLPAPAVDGDDALPWVRYWDHGFQGPSGRWYIENSLTTIGKKDPLGAYNSLLWNVSQNDNSPYRKTARDQKRRLHYVANIYVVSCPANPESEGKVYRFRFGKKIFDKIQDCYMPPFDEAGRTPDDSKYDPTNAFDPFDLWQGANFKIRIRKVDGFPNYDLSSWEPQKPLRNDDAELEAIWKSEYSLKSVIAEDKFKSYDELAQRLADALGITVERLNSVINGDIPVTDALKLDRVGSVRKREVEPEDDVVAETDVDDDELKEFRMLAEG